MNWLFLTLIIGVAGAVNSAGLLGARECTYGPSFWCHSLSNAKQCSAVTHCIQTTWEHQKLQVDNDSVCSICKEAVQEARDTLESKATQAEVKRVLENMCNKITLRDLAEECVIMVDDYTPQLLETLASQMDPQVVCATAELCNSARIDIMLRNAATALPHQQLSGSSSCNDCNSFVNDFINYVKDHPKQELMDRLLAICGELGSVSDGCSALVSVNIDVIYDFITTQVKPEEICTICGMCDGSYPSSKHHLSAGENACDFCKIIAGVWRDEMATNSTEAEFMETLEGMCRQTGSFQNECLDLVQNYGRGAYDYLLNHFRPEQLCEVAGVCGAALQDKPVWTVLHTDSKQHVGEPLDEQFVGEVQPIRLGHMTGQDEFNALTVRQQRDESRPISIHVSVLGERGVLPRDNQACTMCEFTLHFIQVQLQDKATKKQIEDAVKGVCKYLPKDLEEQCDDYVDAYGDQVIALLQQEIDPSIVCPMIGLCPSNSTVSAGARNRPQYTPEGGDSHQQPNVADDQVTCVACEFIMVKVKELLGDKTNEEAVRDALDKVCSALPHSLVEQCENFVNNNAVEVMQLISGGVNPQQVCTLLNFCHNNTVAVDAAPLRPAYKLPPLTADNQLPISRLFGFRDVNSDTNSLETSGQSKTCVLCEFVVNVLEKLLVENSTEAEVEHALKSVCLYLPATLQEDCLGFMEQYSRAFIELLVKNASPVTVCRELRICRAPNMEGLVRRVRSTGGPPVADVADDRKCTICMAVVNTQKPQTNQLTVTSDQLCNSLMQDGEPTAESTLCMLLRETFHSELLQGESKQSAKDVCSSGNNQYCPKHSGALGSSRCTWGPAFWCASLVNAQSCGAAPHCQQHVWAGAVPAK